MNDSSERRKRGLEVWEHVTQSFADASADPYKPADPFSVAMIDFVAAEVWARPQLSMRDRRWISLSSAAIAGHPIPIQSHVRSALASGDITEEELREFVLHFACYAGWPLASYVNSVINEVAGREEAE